MGAALLDVALPDIPLLPGVVLSLGDVPSITLESCRRTFALAGVGSFSSRL